MCCLPLHSRINSPEGKQNLRAFISFLAGASNFAFAMLAYFTLRGFLRKGDRTNLTLALSTGLLWVTSALGYANQLFDYRFSVLSDMSSIAFLWSGYALLMLRDSFLPLPRLGKRAAAIATAAVSVFVISARLPAEPQPMHSLFQVMAVLTMGATWGLFVVESMVRFYLASNSRPAVQKARLRALSLGYLVAIMVAAVAIVEAPGGGTFGILLARLVGLVLVPLLYIGLSPPTWLRRLWQLREEALLPAMEALIDFSAGEHELAAKALEWSIRITGADGGYILADDGRILANQGLDDSEISGLASVNVEASVGSTITRIDASSMKHAISTPLPGPGGIGSLTVITGPFTPFFGSEEAALLTNYAAAVSVALERVKLLGFLEQETRRNQTLFHTMSDLDIGFLLSENGRALNANKAYCNLVGYSLEELTQMESLMQMASPAVRDKLEGMSQQRAAGDPVPEHYDTQLVNKAGEIIDVEVASKRLQMDGRTQVFSVVRDITSRRREEKRLSEAYAKEREAVTKLRELDQLKSEFLSTVSHELRTPLTTIQGFASTLVKRWDALDPTTQKDFIKLIEEKAKELNQLITDLLDFTRMEQGNLQVRMIEMDVVEEVRRSIGRLSQALADHVVETEAPANITVFADPEAFGRVFQNLLTNAAKYSGKGTRIKIKLTEDEETAIVSVADEGIGIVPEELDNVFKRFYRTQRGNDAASGNGIGLAIAKEFAEAQGGTIWVQSEVDRGSTFSFSLQKVKAEQPLKS